MKQLPKEHCDEYNKWFPTLASLFNSDPTLKPLAKAWSKRSRNYSEAEFDRVWSSLEDPKSEYKGQRRTIASLWHIVKAKSQQPKFETYTLDHLLAGDFRVTYLIDGILVAGQPCLCVGPQKSLKTTLLLYMALCLSMGKSFLGRACTKNRVLFMSGESGMATLQETAMRMIAFFSGEYDPDTFHLQPQPAPIRSTS